MDNRPIGIFDSGSGGLSIFRSLEQSLPQESFVYVGDHKHMPYGEKTPEYVRDRSLACIRFLLSQNAKMVIVACNTATVVGIDVYRKAFPTIPIVGVVPVVKTAATISKTKRFVVLSTPSTAKSEYQKNLIATFASDCQVYSLGNAELVRLVEELPLHSKETSVILERLLRPYLEKNIDVVVLGCTHFPFLKSAITAITGPQVSVLDSGDAISRQVDRILEREDLKAQNENVAHQFFTSGDPIKVGATIKNLLARTVVVTSMEHFGTIEPWTTSAESESSL